MKDHHAKCPKAQAWDIGGVACECPPGWPRKDASAPMSTPAGVEQAASQAAREYVGKGDDPMADAVNSFQRVAYRDGYLAGHAAAQAELERANALLREALNSGGLSRSEAIGLVVRIHEHLAGEGRPGREGAP